MQAMYNYTRHQKEAQEEKEKANSRLVIICICMGIIVIICLSTYIIIRELSQKKKDAEQKYLQSLAIIEQAQHDSPYQPSCARPKIINRPRDPCLFLERSID